MVDMSSPAVIAWWSGGSENRLDGQIVRLKIERMDRQIDGQIDIDDSLLLYLFFVFVFCTTCSRSLNIWVQLIYLIYLFYYNSINLNIYLSAHLSIYLLLEADNLVPEPVDLLLLLPLAHRQLPVLHGSVLKGGVHQFSSRVVMENES